MDSTIKDQSTVSPEKEVNPGKQDFIRILVVSVLVAGGLYAYDGMYGLSKPAASPEDIIIWSIPFVLLWCVSAFAWYSVRRWQEASENLSRKALEIVELENRQQVLAERANLQADARRIASLGYWDWDLKTNDLWWSDEIFQIFNIEKGSFKLSYETYLQLVHKEDRHLVREAVDASLNAGSPLSIDHRIRLPEGDIRTVHFQGEVTFQNGEPVRINGAALDVTDRKQAETELRYQFGALQMLIDTMPMPVLQIDNAGTFMGCNKVFEDFYGLNRRDVIGKSVKDLEEKNEVNLSSRGNDVLLKKGGMQTYEEMLRDCHGDDHCMIIHKAGIEKKDGTPDGLIATMIDITDRKTIEAALMESEGRFRNFAESASDWFWETDEKHCFSYLSKEAEDNPGMVIGGRWEDLKSDENIETDDIKWDQHIADVSNHLPFRDFDYLFRRIGDKQRYIKISGMPLFDADGTFLGYRGTGTDVTERRRVDQALRDSELRHRNFASDAAHELRTPLAVVRAQLDNLPETEEVENLRQDVDNMSRMVTQLLAITRIETYKPEESFTDVDLFEVCRNVATLLAPIAIREKRSIEVTGENEPVIIRGNRESLEQAVRNLTENSIKYSSRNSVITLHVGDDEDPSISVIDRGRGVPQEQREEIFERFQRADRRTGGAGLGLSIVERTVKNHGASISIEDTPEGGATFVIRFVGK